MTRTPGGNGNDGRGLKIVRAACPHDCPDTCAMLVTVEGGRAVKVAGDPEHPFTRGFLCTKVANYHERTHSPERVKTPLRRVGAKGEGKFEPISWDEALDEIASRFRALAESDEGAQTIMPYSYCGTMGLVQSESMDRRFFNRLGASLLERTICATAGTEGMLSTLGAKLGTDPERFADARLIAIDPRRTRTADQCDEHVAPLPGTDAALALGLMHVIFAEGLEDKDYLERHTVGVEELRRHVREYPPERVAEICGLEAETIVRLAREYAQTRPAVIRLNYGVQRHAGGGMAVSAITLPAGLL